LHDRPRGGSLQPMAQTAGAIAEEEGHFAE
jgi:hypothetical protein